MRPCYTTITPAEVNRLARWTLESTLHFRPPGSSVTPAQLLDLLLLLAATTRTLFAVVQRYYDFSHETARKAVYANLPTPEVLTERLVDALHAIPAFSRRDRRRAWNVAIDTHNVPYYGCRSTPRIIGGQKKHGTKYFHSYATAVLIHRRRRYTVGLVMVEKGLKPHQVVDALLDQIRARGLSVGGVVLDAGFDSGETILRLQQRKVSYTIPLRRKGKASSRRNAVFAKPTGTLDTVRWVTEKTRQAVSTRVLVWQRKGEARAKVYAFEGWGSKTAVAEFRRARRARRRYRERFGIETSYRQKNQGRGWTTSRNATYRLLLEGVALVLRQVWVHLTRQIAVARGLRPGGWVSELPLARMLEWLVEALKARYPTTDAIPIATSKNKTIGNATIC